MYKPLKNHLVTTIFTGKHNTISKSDKTKKLRQTNIKLVEFQTKLHSSVILSLMIVLAPNVSIPI